AEEALRHQDRMRQPERRLLLDVGDGDAEAAAVADRVLDLLTRIADDDADVADPRRSQGLDAIEEDGLVGDGNELLGGGERDGPQAGATAPGKDQPFHFSADYSSLGPETNRGRIRLLHLPTGNVVISSRAILTGEPSEGSDSMKTLKEMLAEARQVIPEQGPTELKRRLDAGEPVLLVDVRDPDEY